MRVRSLLPACGLAIAMLAWQVACGGSPGPVQAVITADGSSTVYPLTEAVAEDFQRAVPGTRVTVGVAGTGGGLRRFCRGGLDLADASRPITRAEAATCAAAGVSFLEVPVAFDGIVVAVHPSNTWVDSVTVGDLRRLWRHEAEGQLLRWSQWRAGYPDRELHLFGAGVDSGTFDYFTGVITGAPRDSRGDYTSSEDDNMLVQGVATDPDALGYFGFAYFEAHQEYLRAVPVRLHDDAPAVAPSRATIQSGAYQPLARPVFVYVNARSLDRPDVRAFLEYYVTHVTELANDVGYVPLDARVQAAVKARVDARQTGSLFAAASDAPALTLAARLGVEPPR
jgi:phosphate transport system substrate-binding protein